MSSNLKNDRSVITSKMYPIDLAPQKITIVKSMSNSEVKMAHLIAGQPKTTASGQIISHSGPVSLMRPNAQILSPGVNTQPQMIVSGSPLLQGTQIVNQGTQLIGQGSQIISQPQIISPSGQILSPGTQIISQGTQLSAQVSSSNNISSNIQVSVPSSVMGQVLSVGGLVSQGPLVRNTGNLVVSSSVRTLPPSVRVLPPLPHHNTRPVLSTVNVSNTGGVLVSKGVQSHVPRGPAAGASLAVRPVTPASTSLNNQGVWPASSRGRGVVYGTRAAPPRAPRVPAPCPPAVSLTPVPPMHHSAIVTLPNTTVITSNSVIAGTLRASTPTTRATPPPAPAPRPLPLLQRNYQPKMVGVASVGVRGVGNSAPTQLYYEVPRAAPQAALTPRLMAPYSHVQTAQVSAVQTLSLSEARPLTAAPPAVSIQPRPTILRKRDAEDPPGPCDVYGREGTGWEGVPAGGARGGGSGGSTTISAASSPAPDETDPHRADDVSPRKKPRKQMLTNEVRQCQEYQPEEAPPTPPPVEVKPPKRPQLSSTYVCGWRSTALHFVRPADVKRREPRAKDIVAIASQKHVLTSAEGWKVHHLTAQMDDLVSLEADVSSQLSNLLRTLECTGGKALSALQPHSHTLMELLKGNIQRSKIVCESIQEAREDVLRVFTHRNFVSDILTRQADKRCFRKHRSQS